VFTSTSSVHACFESCTLPVSMTLLIPVQSVWQAAVAQCHCKVKQCQQQSAKDCKLKTTKEY